MEPQPLPAFEKDLFNLIVKHYGDPSTPLKSQAKYDNIMKSAEKVMLIYALIKKRGNLVNCSAALGINRNTMRKMTINANIVPKWFISDTLYCPRIKMGIVQASSSGYSNQGK